MRHPAPIGIDLAAPVSALPAWLTLPEAAAYMRRSTRALARWEARGLLRVVRPAGGNPLVARAELERLLSQGAS
jgi:hypothetical protein